MSDRSFGDHAFRNVVKNPLLSTSVTGLSIEDLTHNAVLLPAVPSQEMSTRRDERSGSQTRTLRHSEHDIANLPSGDTNFNIHPPSTHTNVDLNTSKTQSFRSNELSPSNVSKTSAKSDDDFDVNEYFARLQGTRYVSAPLNSTLKEDQNANLQASEENLEEINLNEPEKGASPDVQQSITADIAQNFSQLPTVLPQMASVVFNSFSNILSMKSREQTPDESKSYYQEPSVRQVEPSVPMMGVPDIVKDIAPPPLKEPPPVGTANYRITTRKKVYAQIPGLTSGETVHSMPTYNQPPVSQAAPIYFVPDANLVTLNTGEIDRGERNEIDNTPPSNTTDFNNAGDATNTVEVKSSTYDIFTPNVVAEAVREVNVFNPPPIEANTTDSNNAGDAKSTVEVKSSTYDIFTPNVVAEAVREVNVFNPPPIEANTTSEQVNHLQSQLVNQTVQPPQSLREGFAPPVNTQGPGTVIPPPPVSFNLLRTDNQTSAGKSVLPPSVARRISANQPIIRNQPASMPQYNNIFVPQSIPEGTQGFERPPETVNTSLSTASTCQTESVLPTASLPGVQTITTITTNTTGIPPSSSITNMSTVIESRMNVKPAVPQSMFAQTASPSYPPSVLTLIPSGPAVSQEQNSSPVVCPPPIKHSMVPPAPQNLPQPSESVTDIMQLPEEKPNLVPNVAQTLFSPSSPNLQQEAVSSATFSQDKNISTPPMFFNPLTSAQSYSGQTLNSSNTNQQNVLPQFFNPNDMPPAPITSVPEPPKLQGNTNYRMTKKKPQYYSGPIEGVGSISNNIKPVLNPVQSSSFHGSLFTPQESTQALSQNEPSYPSVDTGVGQIPFDNFTMPPISNHNLSSSVTSVPQEPIHGHYDTPFDFSRPTTDRYKPPKQESTGFGLIGSLKSKLSSIDIGKIQNTVTTFFDPAYNEVRTEQPNQLNYSNEYYNSNFSATSRQSQEQAVGLEMFVVPSAEPTPQFHNDYKQSHIPLQSHYGFIDQTRSESTFRPTNFDLQTTSNQYGFIGYQQQSSSQYGANEQFSSSAISQPSNQNNQYRKTSQYSTGGQILSERTQHGTHSCDFQATTQSYFDCDEAHRSDLTTKQIQSIEIQAATQYDISGRILPEPTAPQIIHDSNLQTTTQSQHSIREKEQLETTLKPSCYNLDTQAPTQGYCFNKQILKESTSQQNSHDLKDTETSQGAQNVIEQMQSRPIDQQSGNNLNQQATCQSPLSENVPQVKFTKAFLQTEINDKDKERITKCLADFDVEKFKSLDFNETRAAIEALANALDPDYIDKDAKAKQTEPQFIGPGIILSMPGLTNDTVDQSITYPRILTDEPLTEEQHRKAYEELMNRSADIFDGDVSHVIEPSSRSPTPEIQQTISASTNTNMLINQNQNIPGPPVIDYGYNSDFVSQYLTDNRATPSHDNVLKYDSSSDNTGSDSLRYFIPYKATPQTLEIIAKMGDITLNADDNKQKELDKFPNVIKRETEEKEINNVTKQLIENITAPIQLSNPVEVPLTESDVVIDDNPEFSSNQFAEISHITEETIETIQVQSATELLQDSDVDDTVLKNYIWRSKDAGMTSMALIGDHTYTMNPDTHHAGFSQNNSLFFDNVLTNASDELKAECKHSLDEHIVLPRQMSIPSAPPADDSKSDEGTLDVQSIEQDAKQDFMFIHEMSIEPETDDGKIKELERTSDDHAKEVESFTHRVEKYKQLEETTGEHDQAVDKPSNKSYPSYFDTGNFAADNHYKNSVPQQNFQSYESASMRIPPGFEQEYYRKYNLINHSYLQSGTQDDVAEVSGLSTRSDNENVPQIPDTTTQTSVTQSVTVTSANLDDMEKVETSSDKIDALVDQFLLQKNEIKPRPMKFKRPNVVPLAHSLGMSPERMRELIGHQISNSPPLPSTMTSEDIIRDLILPHLHHSPIRNNEYEGGETHEDVNASLPSTLNVLSDSHNIPHVLSSDDREEETDEGINTPTGVLNTSNNRRESTERIYSHDSASGAQVNMGQSSTNYNEKDSSELPQQLITSATDSTFQGNQQTSSENKASLQDPMNFFTTHHTTFSTVDHRVNDKITPQQETKAVKTSSLPDPASFFTTQATTSAATSSNPDDEEELSSCSRLSSYFSAPPSKKEDHSKSFFELSQSQNHYRQNQPIQPTTRVIEQSVSRFFDSSSSNVILQTANANQISMPNTQNIPQYLANMNLVRELASTKHFTPQNVVTTANYFTIHYDHDVSHFSKGEPDHIIKVENRAKTNSNKNETICKESTNIGEMGETEIIDETVIINSCKNCCDMTSGRIIRFDIESVDLNDKIKHVMDSNTDTDKNKGGDNTMAGPTEIKKKVPHTVNFDPSSLQEDSDETETMMSENRSSSEYSPVKFHWFYLVDVEGKSVWRGFSMTDSRSLERMFHSPDLNENTLVPTDGGRFDVNIMSRLRIAVYWSDKPTDVRRCSWFYKGTTDARYVPYEESVAEKLEEEYRHGVTTGEWHRRLMLPNNEMVVMHGPAVMVHFLQTNNDSFNSSPQLFSFGKRVYRNPPKIRVSQEQLEPIDHLLLLVHGAGEFKHQREKVQSMMRPRVVRRGYVQSEIEDCEPSNIDHLLLLCHGVGSACDMRFRAVEEVVDDFRTTSLQLLQSHYRNSYDNGLVGRIEVLPVSWHASLHSRETGIDRRLAAVTLDSIPRLRAFTNDTVLDVLLYTSPRYCQHIISTVCRELNRIYSVFKKRNPDFKGGVSLGGHSLGSLILYDLLCHQVPLQESKILAGSPESPPKEMVKGDAGTGQPTVMYPPLEFVPDALYAFGSPIAIFECIRGVETLGQDFCLPTCKNFFNIFHPYDPIAYRIEPMINPDLRDIKPYLIPHHKGRKRMHLELKDTMARVGADIKQKIIESIRSTWSSMWKTQPPPDTHLEEVVEEEMEKEECDEERKEESNENAMTTPDMLGKLNAGRRIDYVLQEAPFEMINEYLFAMRSHVCYWESEDTMLLILREIYDSLGIQPDCCVPQQTMTIQRTRVINEETVTGATESPSTSRGSS